MGEGEKQERVGILPSDLWLARLRLRIQPDKRLHIHKERLVQEIRRTVLHELAHHLGMSHQGKREIGRNKAVTSWLLLPSPY